MTDFFFFRLFVHSFIYSFLANCEFMRDTFYGLFCIRCYRCYSLWEHSLFYRVEFFKAMYHQYSPTAMHQDAFNVLCIPNCVDLYVSDWSFWIVFLAIISLSFYSVIMAYRKKANCLIESPMKKTIYHTARLFGSYVHPVSNVFASSFFIYRC